MAPVSKAKQQVKAAVKQTKQVVKEKVLPVVKKAAQATTKAVKNAVKPKNLLNTLQVGLDIVGMVPVVGEIADGVNGIIYAARGDKVNAALSFGAMIPVVSNAATAGKWINKGAKTAKGISESAQKANKGFIGNVKDKVNKQVSNVKTQIQSKVDEIKQQLQSSQLEIVGVNVGRIKDTGTVGRNTTTPSPKPSNSQPPQNGSNKKPAEDKGTGKVDTPIAFKQTKFASSYEARLNQTPSPINSKVGFAGTRGESKCTLNPPPDQQLKKILDEAGIDGIYYKNAVPDFSPVTKAQVEINYMLGGKGTYGGKARRANFGQSDQKLADQLNSSPELASQFGMGSGKISASDIKKYREKNKLTWHELNDVKTMQLVPTKINSEFGHLGGVGEINAGAFKPGEFANK
ncbi:hypothetical Cytosolic Protein [Bacillus sp. B14905]|nr:hypothetical Cytosolic Protein [Bacillus sp. B14905]